MNTTPRFNPLDYPLALMRPARLSEASSWVQHIPFAFALIELCEPKTLVELGALAGESYCAFCQVISYLKLPTRCTAIDTWEGDIHIGSLGPDILASLKAHHDPRYAKFSTLIQSTFDAAVDRFADRSIDLLHIDGCHTYDAAMHDFQTWLPKMSDRGVIIMHDTQERTENFGVWKVWEEISPKYPNLNFRHGHGLGVLAVGTNAPAPLLEFLKLAEDEENRTDIFLYFEYLGDMMEIWRALTLAGRAVFKLHRTLDHRAKILGEAIAPTTEQDLADHPHELVRTVTRRALAAIRADLAARGIDEKLLKDI